MEFWSRLRSFLQLLTPVISCRWMIIMNVTKDFIEIQASKTINRWNLSGMEGSGICSALVPVWYIPSCICHLMSVISCQKCKILQNVLFFSLANPSTSRCTQHHSQGCVFWQAPVCGNLLSSSFGMILIFPLESLYLFVFFPVLVPVVSTLRSCEMRNVSDMWGCLTKTHKGNAMWLEYQQSKAIVCFTFFSF